MLKYIFLSLILSLTWHLLLAQSNTPEEDELFNKYNSAENDSSKLAACIDLSSYYLFKANRLDTDLDSALKFLNQSQRLAIRVPDKNMGIAATALLGNYYVIKGQWSRGNSLSKKAINSYHSNKNYLQEANSWNQLGNSIADTNSFYAQQKLQSFENARQLFIHLGLSMEATETLQRIAISYARQNRFDTAENIMRQVIQFYKPLNNGKMLDAYNTLAEISEYQSDQHKQLKYRLEQVEQMEATADTANAAYYYAKLALIYAHVSMYKESLATILKAIEILKQKKQYDDLYGDLSLAIFDYIELGKPEAALAYLLKSSKEVPPQDLAHEVDLNDMLGQCYAAMKQYAKAEQHYLTMMSLFNTTQNSNLYSSNEQKIIDFIHYNQILGNFYVTTGQYKKAGIYYHKILELPSINIRPITLSKVHLMQFKVDSASNNFISAIRHYQRFKQLEDSLFNIAKNQQIQELNIKYETEKQGKDLQLKQQNIAALTSQTQLQQADLKRAAFTRNVIIVSSLLLLVLAYLGYRVKQRHNRQLQAHQLEINTQNEQLRKLLSIQEKLVIEKEWLLKEVHHRVKNNLQIIISLLETQATFLNDDALIAIQNSQHRIYAMSLIHQKLYLYEDSSSINMAVYLSDLLAYLQECLDTKSSIIFKTDFDEVELDITQAIPIGLIFNEAITNSIKYAFPKDVKGEIETAMKQEKDGKVRLLIADNGIGLPPGWEEKMNNSLGLKLMRGLSEDIPASFKVETTHGTKLIITFEKQAVLKPNSNNKSEELAMPAG